MPFPLIPALIGGGKAIGGLLAGRAGGRRDEADLANSQNQVLANLYGTQQGAALQAAAGEEGGLLDRALLDLQRRGFAQQAPTARAGQVAHGSILQELAGPGVQFGSSTARLMPQAGRAGALLANTGMRALQQGEQFDPVPMTDFQGALLPLPDLVDMPEAGLLDKILAPLAFAGDVLAGTQEASDLFGGGQSAPANIGLDQILPVQPGLPSRGIGGNIDMPTLEELIAGRIQPRGLGRAI